MTPEFLGMWLLALGVLIGLIVQVVNLFSKLISKPVQDLANAIHSLEKLFERFVIIQDNQENTLDEHGKRFEVHGVRFEKIEDRLSKVEMNCAISHARDRTP